MPHQAQSGCLVCCAVLALSSFNMTGQILPAQLRDECRSIGERAWECQAAGQTGSQVYTLVLPERADRRTALVVWLHGSGRDHRTLMERPETRGTLAASRLAVLMPRGGASWWVAPGYPEFVVDLAERVAAALRIPPARRGCGGWSMGAYGSVRLMERYPEAFRSWTGILGLLDFPNSAYPERDNHAVPALFGPPDEWSGHNPMRAAEALRGKSLWFATGKAAFDYRMNVAFHRRLEDLGIPHEFMTLEGSHVFPVVAEALPAALAFHERELGGARAD